MGELVEIKVPDIGEFKDVPVIEILVKPGDEVRIDDPLVTLESDKAILDVPAPHAGVIKEIRVQTGDKVSEGSPLVVIQTSGDASEQHAGGSQDGLAAPSAEPAPAAPEPVPPPSSSSPAAQPSAAPAIASVPKPTRKPHASPLARRFARELGVDITRVTGGGKSGRILKADVENFIKGELARLEEAGARAVPLAGPSALPPWPRVDFASFGPTETKPLSRIKKLSGPNLARNWVMIPHVTQFDEADITDLEAFRRQINQEGEAGDGVKVTILAFVLKACAVGLKRFPEFNSSLEGGNLILKKYFHVGFAVDTADGLLAPVLRDVDRKGVIQVAQEMAGLSAAAREGKLRLAEMQGGCFTVSNLGGIGGVGFTPIINAPEVAILGVAKSAYKPVYRDGAFAPRLILPLSLSYDHRVIDGAMAARFTSYLCGILGDFRRGLL